MMKRLALGFWLLAFGAAFGSAYIPKASVRQMAASPLRHAELCWIENADGAEVYIGGASGQPLRATDPAALRGARIRKLNLGEYAVSASSGFTYNPTLDRYTITTTATNTIVITVPPNYNVTDFGYHIEDIPIEGDISPKTPSTGWLVRNGNVAVINFYKGTAASAYIEQISVYAKEFGDGEGFNDLTLTTFMLKDSMGQIDFANLRHWAAHLYDGNRGEHWANYPATNYVKLASKPLVFDAGRDYVASMNGRTQLVFQAGGAAAITVAQGTAPTNSYTYFNITQIDVSDANDVTLSYATDMEGFELSGFGVSVCEDLTQKMWFALTEGDYTATATTSGGVTTGTVACVGAKIGHKARFFKLAYRGMMTDAVRVTLRGTVVVKDALILRDPASGKHYKITVTGGTLAAEEVSL